MLYLDPKNGPFSPWDRFKTFFIKDFKWSITDLKTLQSFPLLSTFVTQKFTKKLNLLFSYAQIFLFQSMVHSKPFFEMFFMTNFEFKQFWKFCLLFPKNSFNFLTQKSEEKWKMSFPNIQNTSFWTSSYLQCHILKLLLWTNVDLNTREDFIWLFQKTV